MDRMNMCGCSFRDLQLRQLDPLAALNLWIRMPVYEGSMPLQPHLLATEAHSWTLSPLENL